MLQLWVLYYNSHCGVFVDIGNSYLGNSTFMKVILTKNLIFIMIIYHTKFQFAKISRTMKKCNFLNFYDFYVLKNGEKMHFFHSSIHFRKLKLGK